MLERRGKLSELMLNLLRSQLTLNQRVPGSSPGALGQADRTAVEVDREVMGHGLE